MPVRWGSGVQEQRHGQRCSGSPAAGLSPGGLESCHRHRRGIAGTPARVVRKAVSCWRQIQRWSRRSCTWSPVQQPLRWCPGLQGTAKVSGLSYRWHQVRLSVSVSRRRNTRQPAVTTGTCNPRLSRRISSAWCEFLRVGNLCGLKTAEAGAVEPAGCSRPVGRFVS
jgi:hypothetical protein